MKKSKLTPLKSGVPSARLKGGRTTVLRTCLQAFLDHWLGSRSSRSEGDLAAALLIYLLWHSKTAAAVEGFCGLSFHGDEDDLKSMGIAFPDDLLKGLRILEKARLIALHYFSQPLHRVKGSQTAVSSSLVICVDLLWVAEHAAK
jgi:hypothetical protein